MHHRLAVVEEPDLPGRRLSEHGQRIAIVEPERRRDEHDVAARRDGRAVEAKRFRQGFADHDGLNSKAKGSSSGGLKMMLARLQK
ncbi:hypothetical protein D3C86_1974390 [compost metagenome]